MTTKPHGNFITFVAAFFLFGTFFPLTDLLVEA